MRFLDACLCTKKGRLSLHAYRSESHQLRRDIYHQYRTAAASNLVHCQKSTAVSCIGLVCSSRSLECGRAGSCSILKLTFHLFCSYLRIMQYETILRILLIQWWSIHQMKIVSSHRLWIFRSPLSALHMRVERRLQCFPFDRFLPVVSHASSWISRIPKTLCTTWKMNSAIWLSFIGYCNLLRNFSNLYSVYSLEYSFLDKHIYIKNIWIYLPTWIWKQFQKLRDFLLNLKLFKYVMFWIKNSVSIRKPGNWLIDENTNHEMHSIVKYTECIYKISCTRL